MVELSGMIAQQITWIALVLALPFNAASLLSADEAVDFQRQIRPILAEHCLECHGPDAAARQAELRLDTRDSAIARRGAGGFAIAPGNPDASEVLLRVTSPDPNRVMPPPEHNKPLSGDQVALLRQWIGEGASYTRHWAFVAPERPVLPTVEPRPEAPVHPIDRFVNDRLRREGLTVAPPATPESLCRRIFLDLVGLPPEPSDIDVFVELAREDRRAAVVQLVDRLLGSEHYGEKWARHWMDVARYADSNGYEKDMRREQWAWRDWVIGALNSDMPYDDFILQQVAGDLLPDRTQDQLVATGFFRNGMVNEEGAIVAEEFRKEGMFDRLDCLGKAVLGLSLQCAQCHTHKYDPISHDEYYGMFAFLNDTYESQSWVYTDEQRNRIASVGAKIQSLEDQVRLERPDWKQEVVAWAQQEVADAPAWDVLDTTEQVWEGGLNHPTELTDHSVLVLGHRSSGGKLYVIGSPQLDGLTGLRLEALTHGDLPFGGPGRSDLGLFAVAELRVDVKQPESDTWERLALKNATADFSEVARVLEGDEGKEKEKQNRVGPVAFLIDDDLKTAWRTDRGPVRRHTASAAVVQFAEPVTRARGTLLKVTLEMGWAPRRKDSVCAQLGRLRLAVTRSRAPAARPYDHAVTMALGKASQSRTATERAAVFTAWYRTTPELKSRAQQLAALEAQFPVAETSVLSLTERKPDHHRLTHLLDRGVWDRPKHTVTPHVPAVLHSLNVAKPDRLDFARWLVDRRSPLAARVQVNRVWQAIFGLGLVETPEDFGTRAPQPEYLDVLDWLAVDFMENGWSTKHLIRTILSSRTYQRSSRATAELLKIDPRNQLLARGPRFRADAEVVRDIALTASGLLSRDIGGPSIIPPMPKSVLDYNYTRPGYWTPASPPQRYRRALYVFRRRSMPDPMLSSFDAPNADFACARRLRSNTPLASLATLNEPIFVEAARALALRVLREGGPSDVERADYAFRLCTGRHATPAERAALVAFLNEQRVRLSEGWLSINAVATGDSDTRPALPPDSTPRDAAAWTIAARVMLNLDETLTKN